MNYTTRSEQQQGWHGWLLLREDQDIAEPKGLENPTGFSTFW
tara:strand:+ start:378 stop:503 length:126 start_codon:yes stop_codon:yes gene_type:complete